MSRHVKTVLAVLAVTVASGALALPAQARPPKSFFGIQAWEAPDNKGFSNVKSGKFGVYRQLLFWSIVEDTPGARRWEYFDAIVARAAKNRVPVLAVVHGTPQHRGLYASSEHGVPPQNSKGRAAYAKFVSDAAARYGPRGTFWAANKRLPKVPIRQWQLWNEPNGSPLACRTAKCKPKSSPRRYAQLVQSASKALKRRDRGAKIGLAGMAETERATSINDYLKALYKVRGFKSAFDAVGLHPYAEDSRGVEGALARSRTVMNKAGDRAAQLWLTEIGWGTAGRQRYKQATTKKGQVEKLKRTYNLAVKKRSRYRIGLIVWFSLQDRYPTPTERAVGHWQSHTGLFDLKGRPKGSWAALLKFTGGRNKNVRLRKVVDTTSGGGQSPDGGDTTQTEPRGSEGSPDPPSGGGGDPGGSGGPPPSEPTDPFGVPCSMSALC